MLAAYRAADWVVAGQQLPFLTEHGKVLGLTNLYTLYRERIETLTANPPPAGWDGIYDARSK